MSIETYLGFDVGTKRTGIAIANSLTRQASGIGVVQQHKNGATNWDGFDKIIAMHNVSLFVVGLPLDPQGNEQEMSLIAKSFARKLAAKYAVKVELIDEHLSSNEAKKQLKYNHRHPNAKRLEVDKRAAQLILQTWLNEQY